MNKYNTSAATIPSFRINCIYTQLKSNAKNATNPAINRIINEIADKILEKMRNINNHNKFIYSDYNIFIYDKILLKMDEGRKFISQLMELMKKGTYDYDLLKYTTKVLDQKDYILGNDELPDPEE